MLTVHEPTGYRSRHTRPSPALVSESDLSAITAGFPEVLESITAITRLAADIRAHARSLSASDMLAGLRGIEDLRRRLDGLSAELTAQFSRESDTAAYGARSTRSLLREKLRISGGEAQRRLRLSEAVGSRTSLTGESMEPEMPALAEGIHSGTFSACQVTGAARVAHELPSTVWEAEAPTIDRLFAENLNTVQVADIPTLSRRVLDRLDPDGEMPSERTHPDRYHVTLSSRKNGDWSLTGLLTPATGTALHALLTDRSADRADQRSGDPRSGTPGSIDAGSCETSPPSGGDGASPPSGGDGTTADIPPRTAEAADSPAGWSFLTPSATGVTRDGEPAHHHVEPDRRPDGVRRHERFSQLMTSVARDRTQHGPGFALIVSATAEQMARGRGEVETQAGTPIRLEDLLALSAGGQFFYHSTKPGTEKVEMRTENRFANKKQMVCLTARDHGCTFPDCDMPAGWCDAHHIVPHARGGPTDTENLTLVCAFHHHQHERWGWEAVMIDGLPAWRPPGYLDAFREPVFHSRFRARLLELPAALVSTPSGANGREEARRRSWDDDVPPF
ncbi:DUF222 domain-containing protein [Brevibacterium sp. NPDC049920]|uniref:HNH endonuclease signature motif containing protein n=1 Tax=Brevibacterium sp. NPDC049920 TaxID=3155279 RepID=UPI0025CCAA69|nr:HNH endonuclease signature motif containing protein [uncultured Brevibacterium sp.]